jgi:hypothetical protein
MITMKCQFGLAAQLVATHSATHLLVNNHFFGLDVSGIMNTKRQYVESLEKSADCSNSEAAKFSTLEIHELISGAKD